MIRGKFAAVAAVVVLAVAGPATPAVAVASGAVEALPYQIKSRLTGSCLTNPHMSQADEQGMIQWTCPTVSADQQWYLVPSQNYPGLYQFRNGASGKCLTVPNGVNGTQLVQRTCGSGKDQLWDLAAAGAGTLQNPATSQLVGLGAGAGNGVAIVQNFRCGCADQYWSLINV